MNLPTQQQCLDYFEKYVVPRNIFQHCLKVQEVSLFLAAELNKKGHTLNIEQVRVLSLLHDLFKAAALKELKPSKYHSYQATPAEIEAWKELRAKYQGMYEGEIAFEVFKDSYPGLAVSLKRTSDPQVKDRTPEEELVHYCDWRVLRNIIIPFADRVAYIEEVYHCIAERVEEIAGMKQFEKEIFVSLGYQPNDLGDKMEELLDQPSPQNVKNSKAEGVEIK